MTIRSMKGLFSFTNKFWEAFLFNAVHDNRTCQHLTDSRRLTDAWTVYNIWCIARDNGAL